MKHLAVVLVLVSCLALSPQAAPDVTGIIYASQFTSLQAAVDAAPNGGTVIVDAGVWDIGTVEVNPNGLWIKMVTIRGVAAGYFPSSAPLGDGEWDYLINGGYTYGTVLRGHLDATQLGAKLRVYDLTMIGDGTGVAIDAGAMSWMSPDALEVERVYIGNYETGIRVRRSYYLSLSNISLAGVGTAVQVQDSNAVRLADIDVMTCDLGADLQGDTVSWMGGSVQGCDTGVIFAVTTGALGNVHFEQIPGLSLSLTGNGNHIAPNYYASNAGRVLVSGHNNVVTLGLNPRYPIEMTGNYNRVIGSAYLQCNDNGYSNDCWSASYP